MQLRNKPSMTTVNERQMSNKLNKAFQTKNENYSDMAILLN